MTVKRILRAWVSGLPRLWFAVDPAGAERASRICPDDARELEADRW